MNAASELSWKLVDYQAAGIEPPERVLAQPESCEGQLMSDAEVEDYLADSLKTILVLRDRQSPRAATVQQAFLADLEFLLAIGRIDDDQYNELSDEQTYRF